MFYKFALQFLEYYSSIIYVIYHRVFGKCSVVKYHYYNIVRKGNSMNIEQALIDFGFVERKMNLCLHKSEYIFKLKEVHVEVYPESPFDSSATFMLVLRASEKNATAYLGFNRIVLKKNDTNETHMINILASKVNKCYYKGCPDYTYGEFILNIQNIWYRITVFN